MNKEQTKRHYTIARLRKILHAQTKRHYTIARLRKILHALDSLGNIGNIPNGARKYRYWRAQSTRLRKRLEQFA